MSRRTRFSLIISMLFVVVAFFAFTLHAQPAKFLSFFPQDTPIQTIIIYPDWLTSPESYSSLAHTLTSSGFAVIIPRFPFNLPFFSVNSLARLFQLTHTSTSAELIVLAAGKSGNHLASQLIKLQNSESFPPPQRAIFLNSAITRSSFADYQGLVAFISASAATSATNLPSTTAFINIPGLTATSAQDYTPAQLSALLETIQIFTDPSYNPQLLLPTNQGGV